jgi:hypothetical protein
LRNDDPERFDELKDEVLSFRNRLRMVRADAGDLKLQYEAGEVAGFVGRNLFALLFGFPLFAVGLVLFAVPFLTLRGLAVVVPVSRDRVATLKFTSALVMVPLWWALLSAGAWEAWGPVAFTVVLVGALPLAMFTRYFLERRAAALGDLLTFWRLGNRQRLRDHLLFEGERLQEEINRIAEQLLPRLDHPG